MLFTQMLDITLCIYRHTQNTCQICIIIDIALGHSISQITNRLHRLRIVGTGTLKKKIANFSKYLSKIILILTLFYIQAKWPPDIT